MEDAPTLHQITNGGVMNYVTDLEPLLTTKDVEMDGKDDDDPFNQIQQKQPTSLLDIHEPQLPKTVCTLTELKSSITDADSCADWTLEAHESPLKKCKINPILDGKLTSLENGVESFGDKAGATFSNPTSSTVDALKEGRSKRQRKRSSLEGHIHLCPVCGITLRPGELSTHLSMERVKVDRFTRPGKKSGLKAIGLHTGKVQPATICVSSSTQSETGEEGEAPSQSDPAERYQSYLRIREGRQSRLCARSKKKKRNSDETRCPVCNCNVPGSLEELNEHIDICLRTREAEDDVTVDVEGDDTYEEYEWAGQTRIRTSTLLPGGLGASGFLTVSKANEEDDVDLDVDGDDEQFYGQPQYSERDVIPCSSDEPSENKERQALRKAFIKSEIQPVESEPTDRTRWGVNLPKGKVKTKPTSSSSLHEGDKLLSPESISTSEEVVGCLKAKIREQEKLLGQDRPKCLICMEPHQIPVTSIQCWHVHCEECWLRTLGVKKVCPQCNMITSSADLRRIYL